MNLLQSALQEVGNGPQAVDAWITEQPKALAPAFLSEASDYLQGALQAGALQAALAAAMLLTKIHMRRGDRRAALRSKVQEIEVLYLLADTPEAYQQAYELATMVRKMAQEAKFAATEFWAAGLAADSAYWCSTVAAGDEARKRWIRAAIETLETIDSAPAIDEAPGPWQRFVSVLVATYQTATAAPWGPDQDTVSDSLRGLAAVVERLIPLDFSFADLKKTAHVAHHLADLSARFGKRSVADARTRAVQQSVKSDEWSE